MSRHRKKRKAPWLDFVYAIFAGVSAGVVGLYALGEYLTH